jgi:hypothetical protein
VIQHIVLFTPRSELSDEERRAFARTTIDTLVRAQEIRRFTVGRRVRVDPGYTRSFGDKTYDYAAVLEFENQAALVRYLHSADHAELGRLFWKNCQNTVVSEVDVVDAFDDEAIDKLV